MSDPQILNRNDIAPQYKWNAESVYASDAAWTLAADAFPVLVQQLEQYNGKLAESPKILLQALNALDAAYTELGKLYVYASISHEVDSTLADATRMLGKAGGLMGDASGGRNGSNPGSCDDSTPLSWVGARTRTTSSASA